MAKTLHHYINGKPVEGTSGRFGDIFNPATGDQSARDSGWVDEAHQVGVTAQEVAPDLYIAVGIRGDTAHNAAIARARQVIAVHANPDAPIFEIAQLGVVGDLFEIVPKLTAAVKSAKG